MEKGYFLGVDGGATKSKLIILTLNGKKVFETEGKSLNHRNISKENFIQDLYNLIYKANKKYKILFSCLALAAIDTTEDKKEVSKIIEKSKIKKILKSPYIVEQDVEVVLPSINADKGVAVIAGTGSNFYAKNKNQIVRAGGLDYLLADVGSAFDIGQKVLRSAVRSSDGRGEKTILERLVLKKENIKNIRDLVNLVYRGNPKRKVAEFAPLTCKALKRKDRVAKKILLYEVDELELGIITVAKKVKLNKDFKICLVGGVFKNDFILRELRKRIKKRFKNVEIIIVKNPAMGAAKLAIKEWKE